MEFFGQRRVFVARVIVELRRDISETRWFVTVWLRVVVNEDRRV
jgi:hypothetical protein